MKYIGILGCCIIVLIFLYLIMVIFKNHINENILDTIYYDLYDIPSSHPEIERVKLVSTNEQSNTINKQIIYLNLDSFLNSHTLETYNYLIFKSAHELAHVKCDEFGHTNKFKIIFGTLLNELSNNGKYSDNLRKVYE